ncbi:MAG: hypothetical protein M3137_00525, partial [Actinomycetota bacterium]|nr:hypothetical protein [Actinomycetota bacterium]
MTGRSASHDPVDMPPAAQERPSLWRPRPGLRVDWHRATMAHLQSVYPFHADEGFGERGPYLGVNVTG